MWEVEIVFVALMAGWILYELYGRHALEWIAYYGTWIRIAGGCAVLAFLYWQARAVPDQFADSMGLLKGLLIHSADTNGGGGGGGTKERRNVSALQKKRVAASQEWRCGSCRELLDETYEVDHRLALFQGGTNDPDNLVALCPHCHRKKTVAERL